MQIALDRIGTAGLPDLLRRFGAWWLTEFLNLFPVWVVERVSGRGRILLVLSADQDGVRLEAMNNAHAVAASKQAVHSDNISAEIDQFLHSRGLDRSETDVGLRLPLKRVFSRQLFLPAEALGAIDAIVALDLAKKTPFRVEDIFASHAAPERVEGSKIRIWQWIIRRQDVHQALAPLGIGIEDLAFVVSDSLATGQPAPFINLRPGVEVRGSWYRKAMLGLCCSALVLSLLAGGLKYWNQQSALDRLDEQIATVGGKARQVRALVDQMQEKKNALLRLRLQRSERPGLVDLWEEITRVLPAHSWLTEFRVVETAGKREGQIAISGFSNAASSLVGIIDSSPVFFDATLASPIAFDSTEGRERFALQAKIKALHAFKEAAR